VEFPISGSVAASRAAATGRPLFSFGPADKDGDAPFTFTIMPSAQDEATLWVREARKRAIKKIAALTQDDPTIRNEFIILKEEAEKAGIAFVYEDEFDATMIANMKLTVAAAKATGPDVYFVEAFNPALDTIGRQFGEAGIHSMSSAGALSLTDRPDLFEGAWYTDSDVSPAFKTRLEQRYPGVRLDTHIMPYAYDSFRLLAEGFESGNVLSSLRSRTEYDGASGKITKAAGTGNFRSTPVVWVVKHGKPIHVK
jgi:ABC-type branched-subunit amino acid transport system substrate-binding protein